MHVGVISTPVVQSFMQGPQDRCLILASDGVWEFITSQEAVQIVQKHGSAPAACRALITEATQRWRKEEGNYRDDITAIVVLMPLLEGLSDGSSKENGKARSLDETSDTTAEVLPVLADAWWEP